MVIAQFFLWILNNIYYYFLRTVPDSEGNLAEFGEGTENKSGKEIAFLLHAPEVS